MIQIRQEAIQKFQISAYFFICIVLDLFGIMHGIGLRIFWKGLNSFSANTLYLGFCIVIVYDFYVIYCGWLLLAWNCDSRGYKKVWIGALVIFVVRLVRPLLRLNIMGHTRLLVRVLPHEVLLYTHMINLNKFQVFQHLSRFVFF